MANLKQLAKRRVDLLYFLPEQFTAPEGWNKRQRTPELAEHIQMLKRSIQAIGVEMPVTFYVDGDKLMLTDGFCRHEACLLAKAEDGIDRLIPARIEPDTFDEADRACDMLTRNSGMQFTLPEKAEVVKQLTGYGWDNKTIAARTGYTMDLIHTLIALAGAPVEAKAMMAAGEVSPTVAVKVIKEHGKTEGVKILKEAHEAAVQEGRTKAKPRDVEKVTAKPEEGRPKSRFPLPDQSHDYRSARLSTLLDTPLYVGIVDGKVLIEIGARMLLKTIMAAPIVQSTQGFKVTDDLAFLDGLVAALEEEDEDGATVVHAAFDAAVSRVINEAEPGWTCD